MQGAEHVTLVARNLNLVIPRLLLAMSTLQSGADTLFRQRAPPVHTPAEAAEAVERGKAVLEILTRPYRAAVSLVDTPPCRIRHLPLGCHCNSGANSQY